MTPEEMAKIDRILAAGERGIALEEEIEGIQRDMRSLDELTPAELEEYLEAVDLWNDGSDPVTRMMDALRRLDEEIEQLEHDEP
jgi:vacuolar-type H+-ATPase subunit I/STV1